MIMSANTVGERPNQQLEKTESVVVQNKINLH